MRPVCWNIITYIVRMRRLHLVGHVIRMQSRCQTPLGTLLTTVPSNCHLRQGHGRLQRFNIMLPMISDQSTVM